jgi:D-alanyl-D-alanine carboxypeptidase
MRKRKGKKIGLWILIFILVSMVVIAYKRPDTRFIIKNICAQKGKGVSLAEVKIDEKQLNFVSVKSIKEKNTDMVYNYTLALINKKYTANEGMASNIVNYKNDDDVKMDKSIINDFNNLKDAVKSEIGDNLYIMDSYRTLEEQKKVYAKDKQIAAAPGSSEHEAGLALDVYVASYAGRSFLKSEAGQFVNKDSWKYGFIIRYPLFKKNITGIEFEPWHIRYVGKPHSEIIYKNKLCLEEYIESLKIDTFYKYGDYIISRQSGDKLLIPNNLTEIVVSPDNMANYIITGKKQ